MEKITADTTVDVYLSGKKLYGNDFSQEQIEAWFVDEAEGYFNLSQCSDNQEEYSYGYHVLNQYHGFSRLPPKSKYSHVLGVGSAHGEELVPILSKCDRLSILDPSEGFKETLLNGKPVNYVKPVASADMPFDSDSFDLITCFGVLHHIPNVSRVVDEIYRVLEPGGYVLMREPIISMGDWRKPRRGLTSRERGIPLEIMSGFVNNSGLNVIYERKCMFSLTSRLRYFISGSVFNNQLLVSIDAILSSFPIWSKSYHATSLIQKIRPTSVFLVLQKPPVTRL